MSSFEMGDEPRSIARTLDAGFNLYRVAFTRLLPLSVASQLVVLVPSMAVEYTQHLWGDSTGGAALALAAVAIGLVAIVIVGYVALSLAVAVRAWGIARGEAPDTAAAARRGLALSGRTLLATLLYALAVAVGTLLLVVPGIYLSLALGLFAVVIVAEDRAAIAALRRSVDLVRGQWWRFAAVITVPTVLYIVVGVVLGIIAFVMFGVVIVDGEVMYDPTATTADEIVNGVVGALLMPLLICVTLVAYHDLALRLDKRVAADAGAVAPGA